MNKNQLESLLWGAAEFLRGQIDASDYKQFIFPLLFFKRLSDVYEEELAEALEQTGDMEMATAEMFHRFNIPNEARWQTVRETGVALAIEFRAGICRGDILLVDFCLSFRARA